MENATLPSLSPRRSPRQERSLITVEAIFEATIQVLLSDGLMRLNTTRVAHRAGVSVGTLYQYFPNKQALLFAVLERHLDRLASAVEKACGENLDAAKEMIAETIVRAYIREKVAQAEVSPSLYRIAMELDARELVESAAHRTARAVEVMLCVVGDGRFANPRLLAQTLTAALFGTVPAFCHRVLSPADSTEAERQLTVMFRAYLAAH